jgi:predicted TPR repeat methyltransferase
MHDPAPPHGACDPLNANDWPNERTPRGTRDPQNHQHLQDGHGPPHTRDPHGARACLDSARQHLRAADFAAAERLLRDAIAHDDQLAMAHELLGKLLYRDSRSTEAATIYRAWLDAIPTDPVAAHLVAATGGAPPPERASDRFVATLFTRAAPDFDAALANLGYRAPQLVFESAMQTLGHNSIALNVLDLGCGTGLCGEWLRPLARTLVGVDLSQGMLEQAHKRKCYDELICEELTTYTSDCLDRFDLITAADVFCYFGDLAAPFASVAALLRPNGCFTFSVEAAETPDASLLLEHGRYAHGADYLKRTLTLAGLVTATMRQDVLRFERGAPVEGLIVSSRLRAC